MNWIENWAIYNFQKLKIEKKSLGRYVHGHAWKRAPKVPFNFHFKIGIEKDIFVYFSFISKLKIWKKHLIRIRVWKVSSDFQFKNEIKIEKKARVLGTMQSHSEFIYYRKLFLTFDNLTLTLVNTRIFVKTNNESRE